MTLGNIDLRAARHVTTLAKHLSFTRAAEELGITQSALSRSVQRFEEAIGLRVFDRNRGGVRLTTVGKEIARRASRLVREADQFERSVQQSAAGYQDRITFGLGHLPAKALLTKVLSEELAENSDLRMRVLVRSPDMLLSMLLLDEVEFVICADRLVSKEAPVRGSPIGTIRTVQLVRSGHPLLEPGTRRQPKEFPWIITQHTLDRQSSEYQSLVGLRDKPQLEIEDLDCLARVTQNSDAIWVTATAAANRELRLGLLRQIKDDAVDRSPIRLTLYSRGDRSLSPAALRLRDRFRAAAKERSST